MGGPPPAQPADAALSQLARLEAAVTRLGRLPWLEVPVPDEPLQVVRHRIQAAARCPESALADGQVGQIDADLAELEHQVTDRLTAMIHAPGWDPGWRSGAFEQVEDEAVACPQCSRPTATRLLLRHVVSPQLHLQTLQCHRCGDIWWTTEPGPRTVDLSGPVDVLGRRGEPALIERTVANHGAHPLRGSVGCAFRRRRNLGMPGGSVQRLVLRPGESKAFRVAIPLAPDRTPADTHSVCVVGLFAGTLVTSLVMLQLA